MKKLTKIIFSLTIIFFLMGNYYSMGWAEDRIGNEDPINDEWNSFDLTLARPLGVVAGVIGSGIFIASLPFTIPTKGVDQAFKILILNPFKFSFVREFPDENM